LVNIIFAHSLGRCAGEVHGASEMSNTVQRDGMAVILRFLLAVILATSISYCSVAIEQAKVLVKTLA
jgi:hypothetical protein